MTLLEELQWRGLYADCTDSDALARRLAEGPMTLYCGFDPTADSLHVGNLVPLLALRRFQRHGHTPIALAGGATGMVGDPSGKSAERNLQTPEQVAHNIESVKGQLAKFLDFETKTNPALLVNNADWMADMTYLDFLREVGKYFTVNWMVAKESVRARMEDRDAGISYTEFSYMLLQAFDFYYLRKSVNCELQVGATDQWGNITAGTELIRKKLGASAYGLVFPLLTKSDGTKYGKSAEGAVWLDPKRTSPYRFYQFFMQAGDADVVKLLKVLTFLLPEEIIALEAEVKNTPGARAAQKALARAVTTLVHGETECANAQRASEAIFSGQVSTLPPEQLQFVAAEAPHVQFDVKHPEISGHFVPLDKPLVDTVVFSGLYPSKNQARQAIISGAIYVNDQQVKDPTHKVSRSDFLHDQHLILRRGARNYFFVSGVAPIAEQQT